MREKIWKISIFWILFVLAGLVLAVLGGMAETDASKKFLGIDSFYYFTSGATLVVVGQLLTLSSFSSGWKNIFWKMAPLWLLVLLFGLASIVAGGVAYSEILNPGVKELISINWDTFILLGAIFTAFGLLPILFAASDDWRESLGSLLPLWILITLGGVILVGLGHLLYSQILIPGQQHVASIEWNVFLIFGAILVGIGLATLVSFLSDNGREIVRGFLPFWGIMFLLGWVFIGLSAVLSAELLDLGTLLGGMSSGVMAVEGAVLAAVGLTPLLVTLEGRSEELNRKFYPLWLLGALAGAVIMIAGSVAYGNILDTNQQLQGIDWDTFYFYGGAVFGTFLGLFVASLERESMISPIRAPAPGLAEEFEEARQEYGTATVRSRAMPKLDATPAEMMAFLTISHQSTKHSLVLLEDAHKKGKIGKTLYQNLVDTYKGRLKQIVSKAESIKKAIQQTDLKGVFEAELREGVEKAAEPEAPSVPEDVEAPVEEEEVPTPAPAGPPAPPPSTAERPGPAPPPPPTAERPGPAPPPPSAAEPAPAPPPPSAAEPTPPSPAPAPVPGDEIPEPAPLDTVGEARPTSIKELRGEMLKELRRLREVFKEE